MKNTKLLLLSVASLLSLASCNGLSISRGDKRSSSEPDQSQSQSSESGSQESSDSREDSGDSKSSEGSYSEESKSSEGSQSSGEEPSTEPAIVLPDGVTTDVKIGDKVALSVKNIAENVTWFSSDTASAVVSDSGEVEFFAPGEVTISAVFGNDILTVVFNATDPEANKSGTCTGTDQIPSEIAVGDTIDLDEIITIKNVSRYYLYTESDTIEIIGHKVHAVKAGEFTFRIHLGRSKRSIAGVVASEDKINFNKLVNSFAYNYSGYLPYVGYELYVTEDGFMSAVDTVYDEYDQETIYYNGSIYDYEKQSIYDFDVTYAPNYEKMEYEYIDFKVNRGYGRSMEAAGIINWPEEMNPMYFEETVVELVDENEVAYDAPAFYFLDNTEYTEVAEAFYNSMFGGGWSLFSNPSYYGVDAKGVVVVPQFDEQYQENYLVVYPCDENGDPIPYFTVDKQNYSSIGVIQSVGTTEIAPITEWKANPVYPEATDSTPLKNFFDAVTAGKNYTIDGGSYWLENGQVTSTPDNMKFMNETFGPFGNFLFHCDTNEFGRTYEITEGKDVYVIPENQGDNYLWNKGAAWIEAVGAGKYYTGKGNRAANDEDVTWDALTAYDFGGQDIAFESLWNPQLVLNPVPSWLATSYDEETQESFSIFDYVSIYDYEEKDDSYVFTLNNNGPDTNAEIYSGAGYGGVLGNLLWVAYGFNIGYTLGLYLDMVEWFDEALYTISVSKDGKTLTFDMPNVYNSTIVYDVFFQMTIVDADPMAPAAAEKIHSVNPDYVVPGQE